MAESGLTVYMAVPTTIKEVLYTQLETAVQMSEARPVQANRTLPPEEYWRDVSRLIRDAMVVIVDLTPVYTPEEDSKIRPLADADALTEASYSRFGARKPIVLLCAGETRLLPVGWQKFPCVTFEPTARGYMTLAKTVGRMILSEIVEELDRRDKDAAEDLDLDIPELDSPTASVRSEQRIKSLSAAPIGSSKDKELKEMLRERFRQRLAAEKSGQQTESGETLTTVDSSGTFMVDRTDDRATERQATGMYAFAEQSAEEHKKQADDVTGTEVEGPQSRLLQLQAKYKQKKAAEEASQKDLPSLEDEGDDFDIRAALAEESRARTRRRPTARTPGARGPGTRPHSGRVPTARTPGSQPVPTTPAGARGTDEPDRVFRRGRGKLIDKRISKVTDIAKLPFSIGRVTGNSIVVPIEQISKINTKITRQDGTYFVEDCGSPNGTFVNGKRITRREPIYDGDRLQIAITATTPNGARDYIFRQDA